jgi:hypothetical protein
MTVAESPTAAGEALPAAHALSVEQVFATLATGARGLTQAEAEARLRRHGRNAIREAPGQPLIRRLLANFTHVMALLLWGGGLIAFAAQLPQLGVAIWLVNLINGAFSFWQEFKAEQATRARSRLLPATARRQLMGRRAGDAQILPHLLQGVEDGPPGLVIPHGVLNGEQRHRSPSDARPRPGGANARPWRRGASSSSRRAPWPARPITSADPPPCRPVAPRATHGMAGPGATQRGPRGSRRIAQAGGPPSPRIAVSTTANPWRS